jgi:integrase
MGKLPKKPAKRSRRVRGSGGVFPVRRRGRTVWLGRLPVGRTPAGRTVYREVSAPTAAEALRKLALLKPPSPTLTVAEWADRWLESVHVRPSTRDSYSSSVRNYIKPTLGHLRVAEVSTFQVEAALRQWQRSVEPATARLVLQHLGTCLGAAVKSGAAPANPVKAARRPPGKRKHVEPLTPADVRRLIAEAAARPATRIFALLAATGCRIGEAEALDCRDVLPGGRLRIDKTLHPKHGIGPPKSANGVRTIRVPAPALPAVLAARGKRTRGPLFAAAGGGRVPRLNHNRRFRELLARLGLARRVPHELRHTAASLMVAHGVGLGTVAQYLGDSVATVVRRYIHATDEDPADALDRVLGGS